jgi:hypothetical protein
MGYQIIKQPDGKLAVFSSITDTIVMWDATEDEVVEFFVEIEVQKTTERVRQMLVPVVADEPRKAYYQFAMTWEAALESDREHGGSVHEAFEGGDGG